MCGCNLVTPRLSAAARAAALASLAKFAAMRRASSPDKRLVDRASSRKRRGVREAWLKTKRPYCDVGHSLDTHARGKLTLVEAQSGLYCRSGS